MIGEENTFRWALLVLVAITLTIAGYHRIQARAAGGPVSRSEEGFMLLAMRGVVGLSFWVAFIAYLVNPGSMAWSALPAADWLRWGGVGFGLLGSGLLYWTLHHLGVNLTDTVVTRAEATLVTSGQGSTTITGRCRPAGPTPTSAERKTRSSWLMIASAGMVYIGPVAVSTRWALRPQNQKRSCSSR